MANFNQEYPAEVGTHQMPKLASEQHTDCPAWDNLGKTGDYPPFFNPGEETKRGGFVVVFLRNHPHKDTDSRFKPGFRELWFDIQRDGQTYTWTIGQTTLLMELKRHSPLAGKALKVQLVPVDESFKAKFPRYRGKDRYLVQDVTPPSAIPVSGQVHIGGNQAQVAA